MCGVDITFSRMQSSSNMNTWKYSCFSNGPPTDVPRPGIDFIFALDGKLSPHRLLCLHVPQKACSLQIQNGTCYSPDHNFCYTASYQSPSIRPAAIFLFLSSSILRGHLPRRTKKLCYSHFNLIRRRNAWRLIFLLHHWAFSIQGKRTSGKGLQYEPVEETILHWKALSNVSRCCRW